MGELERDVRPQPLVDEPLGDSLVRSGNRARLVRVANQLAEERRVREQAALVEAANRPDGVVERLACDEA